MSERLTLAEDFIRSNRTAALRVIEDLPPEASAALIDRVPDELSAQVLAGMQPYYAAKSLKLLPDDSKILYLSTIDARAAAAILRHIEQAEQKRLLDAMSRRTALRIRLVLGYRQSLVGAWMDPQVLSLPNDCLMGEAKARLMKEAFSRYFHVYLVDAERRLRGAARTSHLFMQVDDARPVAEVAELTSDVLLATETLESAAGNVGWRRTAELPVVDREGKFLGVMRLIDLRAALEGPSPSAQLRESVAGLIGLAEICYLGLADVMCASLSDTRGGFSQFEGGD